MTSTGIIKVPFTDLSRELQQKYHYDPRAAAAYSAALIAGQRAVQTRIAKQREQAQTAKDQMYLQSEIDRAKDKLARITDQNLEALRISAFIKPFIFGAEKTTAWIEPVTRIQAGTHNEGVNVVPTLGWARTGEKFIGVIDEPMAESFEAGDGTVTTLYKIGHTPDSSRNPLFTTSREKAFTALTKGLLN